MSRRSRARVSLRPAQREAKYLRSCNDHKQSLAKVAKYLAYCEADKVNMCQVRTQRKVHKKKVHIKTCDVNCYQWDHAISSPRYQVNGSPKTISLIQENCHVVICSNTW